MISLHHWKTKGYLSGLLILLFPIIHLMSQKPTDNLLLDVRISEARNAVGDLTYENIFGSPYYSVEFINSVVHLKNGEHATVPLRYNLFKDEIEFRRDNALLWLEKKDVAYINMGKETLIVEPASDAPGKSAYFFVQDTGKYSLLIKRKTRFEAYVPPRAYVDAVPDRFKRENDLFFLKSDGLPALEIKSKKALQTILKDNPQALEFIKRNRVRVNKSENLHALVIFLNNQ